MMFIIIVLGLILAQIIIQPLIHIGQGHIFFLPVLIMASGAHGRWYEWALYLVALSAVGFFAPMSFFTWGLLIGGSYGLYLLFSQWVEESWLRYSILSVIISVVITISYLYHKQGLSFHWLGSIILSVLLLGAWFFLRRKRT